MNRLSWDTTAPRRSTGERTPNQPRPEAHGPDSESDLARVAWEKPQRISPF
jgi:hypothetical protein